MFAFTQFSRPNEWPPREDGADDGSTLKELDGLLSEGSLGNGRVEYGVATHAVYTCDEEVLMRLFGLKKWSEK